MEKSCTISGTALCEYIGSEGCENCYVSQASQSEQEEIAKSWATTLSMLPNDIDELHMSDKCWFCKEERNETSCYVLLDMVHPEPAYMRGFLLGMGKKMHKIYG